MARRKQMQNPIDLGLQFEAEIVARLDSIAEKAGISRAQLIRNLVEVNLEEVEALQAVGILSLVRFLDDMKERVREKRKAGAAEPATA